MQLSAQDGVLFWDLMYKLHFFVNQTKNIVPSITSLDQLTDIDMETKLPIRDALWESPEIINDFIAENPYQLDEEELTIVESWQQFVKGMFVIERLLKKYAVFLHDEGVFGVLGVTHSLQEIIHPSHLPLMIEAVIIPFKDKIVYDGVFMTYNMYVGSNMAKGFKNDYMKAKREGEIIVSFDPDVQAKASAKTKVVLKDWKPMLEVLADDAKSLRAQSGSPPTWSPAFSLVKASIRFAQLATEKPDDIEALWQEFDKLDTLLNKMARGIEQS